MIPCERAWLTSERYATASSARLTRRLAVLENEFPASAETLAAAAAVVAIIATVAEEVNIIVIIIKITDAVQVETANTEKEINFVATRRTDETANECTSLLAMRALQVSSSRAHARGATRDHRRRRLNTRVRAADRTNVPPEVVELLREYPRDPADVWASKPPWCQPWTIVATGACIVAAPTQIIHWPWWTSALVSVPIGVWWFLFLGVMPKQFANYVRDARLTYGAFVDDDDA